MRQRRASGGWWCAGLAAALLAPTLSPGPAHAGPFDYVKKADEQKDRGQDQQRQEQERRAGEERQRQQGQQQAREREQQERRAGEERARQAEQQRQAGQQRQAERARQAEQQRQIEQQRQLERARQIEQQRHAEEQERQRAAREAQERQNVGRAAQERQRVQQERVVQEQQAREEQSRRTHEERSREGQARQEPVERVREEQSRQEQFRQPTEREEQARQQAQAERAPRQVASGPFGYIRRSDQARGRQEPTTTGRPAPVQREQPRSSGSDRGGARSGPFDYQRLPREGTSRVPSSPPNTYRPSSGSPPRESPFGSTRRGSPPTYGTPGSHSETLRPSGTFPGVNVPRPIYSGGSSSQGSGRSRENGTTVNPAPRGGRGSLDRYFGREARRHRERDRYYAPRPSYGGGAYRPTYGGYQPGYYDPCPYDAYPPVFYYPEPGPQVVIVPAPEVVVVPEDGYSDRYRSRDATDGVSLDQVLDDIEEAWATGKLSLLMPHVRTDGDLQVYRDGEWISTLTRSEFERKTAAAFRDYDTVSMAFEKPEILSDDEASARAEHVYRTRAGREQRVHVTYAFRRYGRRWRIVGLDYERSASERSAAPHAAARLAALPSANGDLKATLVAEAPELASAQPPRPAAKVGPGRLQLVSAPPVRLRDLLNAPRPRAVATLKWLRGGRRSIYTLQAMRGVAPGTVAWALYRQGEKRPAETGVAEISALPVGGWVAVRAIGPRLVTLASSPGASRKPAAAMIAARAFAGTRLALAPALPPVRGARVGSRKRHGR